jgi:hypothetical protein
MLSDAKKTAAGQDGLPYWLFKHGAVELSEVNTFGFKKFLTGGNCSAGLKKMLLHLCQKSVCQEGISTIDHFQ